MLCASFMCSYVNLSLLNSPLSVNNEHNQKYLVKVFQHSAK